MQLFGCTAIFLALFVAMVSSHAALTYPPARNTVGTSQGPCSGLYCSINYDWMSANKGQHSGAWTDADTNMCGDAAFILPSPTPVATFTAGQTVKIRISVNAFHNGYYEFRLCVPSTVTDMPPSTNQGMLDCITSPSTPLLKRVRPGTERATYVMDPSKIPTWTQTQLETRWRQFPEDGASVTPFRDGAATFELEYYLPSNVQCDHCVLHWYWQSLNSWQEGDATTIATTIGERFWNCADIAITNVNGKPKGITSGFLSGGVPPTPAPVPPTPTPVSNPPPTPVSNPTPTPTPPRPPTPTPTQVPSPVLSASCSNVKYGSEFSTWWIAVIGDVGYSLSIGCGPGTLNVAKRGCTYDAGWGRYTCTLSYGGECLGPHTAYFTASNGAVTTCPLNPAVISLATDTTTLEESTDNSSGSNSEDDESGSVDNSVPGWGVALLVVASITVVALLVVLVLMLLSSPNAERF